MVSSWRALGEAHLGMVTDREEALALLRSLSSLPMLRRLSVTPTTSFDPFYPPLPFPSLQSLAVLDHPTGVASLLRSLAAPRLTDICILSQYDLRNLENPLVLVLPCTIFSALESLSFRTWAGPLRLVHLQHFTSCRQLRTVDIGDVVILTGEEINTLVRGWPELRGLTLESIPPFPSLFDLGSLGESAPHLQSLDIAVDAGPNRINLTQPHRGIQHVKLLVPGDQDPKIIEAVVAPMWPNASINVIRS